MKRKPPLIKWGDTLIARSQDQLEIIWNLCLYLVMRKKLANFKFDLTEQLPESPSDPGHPKLTPLCWFVFIPTDPPITQVKVHPGVTSMGGACQLPTCLQLSSAWLGRHSGLGGGGTLKATLSLSMPRKSLGRGPGNHMEAIYRPPPTFHQPGLDMQHTAQRAWKTVEEISTVTSQSLPEMRQVKTAWCRLKRETEKNINTNNFCFLCKLHILNLAEVINSLKQVKFVISLSFVVLCRKKIKQTDLHLHTLARTCGRMHFSVSWATSTQRESAHHQCVTTLTRHITQCCVRSGGVAAITAASRLRMRVVPSGWILRDRAIKQMIIMT